MTSKADPWTIRVVNKKSKPQFLRTIQKWGWVFLFLLVTAMGLERTLKHVRDEYQMLDAKLSKLTQQKDLALHHQENLKERINSQSDPAWIELILKRELGLTPEGQIKILFVEKQ